MASDDPDRNNAPRASPQQRQRQRSPPPPLSRTGTVSSARFNILSTMVGGGCLSLPLAFFESGNALVGPLLLVLTGIVTEFCFQRLVECARIAQRLKDLEREQPDHHQPQEDQQEEEEEEDQQRLPGKDTFESIASEAFGPKAFVVSMGLVVSMCFFGTVGYAVLLRDMVKPLNDWLVGDALFSQQQQQQQQQQQHDEHEPWLDRNLTLFLVVVLVTPFCTLRRLTALKDCGAASMLSLLVLGTCVVIRSVQCNATTGGAGENDGGDQRLRWYRYLRLVPESGKKLLDVVPLYISCFVCHYNILPVHNELIDPSRENVDWWLRSTTWFAVALYFVMGLAGSAYAHCTDTGTVQGNILLDFDENDPLLMVGRMCLAVTITLAFPMLVIPGRDIVIRSLILPRWKNEATAARATARATTANAGAGDGDDNTLREPLLAAEEEPTSPTEIADPGDHRNDIDGGDGGDGDETTGESGAADSVPTIVLLSTSVVLFWSAAALASTVSSIDVVWDLLGSSLSILMSYLIPAGSFLVLSSRLRQKQEQLLQQQQQQQMPEVLLSSAPSNGGDDNDAEGQNQQRTDDYETSRVACWIVLGVSIPLMVVSTANAVANTFF